MEVQVGSVPFKEAIAFFRDKNDITTERWDQIDGLAHAKGFTVAGATNVDLLADIRSLLDDALANGTTIAEFRKGFDAAVQKHGWSYKGKRGWRTRVIFDTNMRAARMAGRWAQFQRVKERRPFLIYMTVGDSRVRPQHRNWHKLVLHIDDAWWNTHFPPNGWGCRCTVINASQRDLDRLGLEVSEAPPLDLIERVNPNTGEVYGMVPKGIDVGWNYNVGKAWLGPDQALGAKAANGLLQAEAAQAAATLTPVLQPVFSRWVDDVMSHKKPTGEMLSVGFISADIVDALITRKVDLATTLITISDREILHTLRDAKDGAGKGLTIDFVRQLPTILRSPKAVLWDKRGNAVLYIFDPQDGDARKGKFVVQVNFRTKERAVDGSWQSLITNSVRTGGWVHPSNLRHPRYEVLKGVL